MSWLFSNKHLLETFGSNLPKFSKIIVHEKDERVMYAIWDYKNTSEPSSIPCVVEQCCKDLEKSGYVIDVIMFGSRRWTEFVALYSLPYRLVYDAAQDRRMIYFIEGGRNRGRLKIENLPEEEVAPQP